MARRLISMSATQNPPLVFDLWWSKIMDEKETNSLKKEEQKKETADKQPTAEQTEHPVPSVKHEREPDAENIMPAKDRPGTL